MVSRLAVVALAGWFACAGPPALGQVADWRAAGGDLFVRAPGSPATSQDGLPALPAPSQPLQSAVDEAAARHGLDPKLLHALVLVESGYRSDAVSPVGAAGLTQLMPATARELGVADRFDPPSNLAGGADYLARQILRFADLKLALAAFNAGPDRVARLGRIPDIPETRRYVDEVIGCYLALAAGRRILTVRDCHAGRSTP